MNALAASSSRNAELAAALAAGVSAATVVRCDEPLMKRTTMRVGGPADLLVEPATEADLAAVVKFCGAHRLEYFVLGRGSNLLVRDGGYRGVVIALAAPHFSRVTVEGDRLHCGAGAKLKEVAAAAKRAELGGLEFLEGIPGSVGGALRMNAGAMGGATFDFVESVRVMDGAGLISELSRREIAVEYRSCALFQTHLALGCVFRAQPAPRAVIEAKLNEMNRKRWEAQPAKPSAGCTFKNPSRENPAGKLVDELGLKGARVGGAVVSQEHGNFIVNDGGATAADVLRLIEIIRQHAKAERGVDLETEVEIIGED